MYGREDVEGETGATHVNSVYSALCCDDRARYCGGLLAR